MTQTRTRRWPLALAVGVLAASLTAVYNPLQAADAKAPKQQRARNVIFVNGDGMAAGHREAARLYLAGPDGRLTMDRLPVSGSFTTTPRDPESIITDSAAGASAWATGEATYNGAISVDVDGNPLPILGAQAKAAGKRTGLATTAQVTDASPAAFFSNSTDRALQDDIARQYLEVSKPDVILGGGEDWWLPAGNPGAFPDQPAEDPTEGSRSREGDLVAQARAAGYQYVTSGDALARARSGKILGLFANQEMFQQRPEGQGDVFSPRVSLAAMTTKALDVLDDSRRGFFLLVEEEAVDEFAHQNNAIRTLQAMRSLDAAVAVARNYVATHPDTLLVVTGDHETGGLTVEDVGTTDESGDGVSAEDGPFAVRNSDKQFVIDWTSPNHSGVDVPVTAAGPGATAFTGKHPNTYAYDVLLPILTRR